MFVSIYHNILEITLPYESRYYQYFSKKMKDNFENVFQIGSSYILFRSTNELCKRKAFMKMLAHYYRKLSPTQGEEMYKKILLSINKTVKLSASSNSVMPKMENPLNMHAYYTLLESTQGDTLEAIKKRYHKLAKQYHPDMHFDKDFFTQARYTKKFQSLHEAFEILKKHHQESLAS